MKQPAKTIGGGLAAWSLRHPIGVVMITLAIMVLGLFALQRLNIDLLPHIIYPDVRVRIMDPGVPATIMEDEITRQLEVQLAITEDAIHIESQTSEGRSAVSLSFEYGKDIDIALRDASTRLDRAKRFLPDTVEPAVIYKRDPSQIPIAEYVVSSSLRDPVELRSWVDYSLGKWLLNIPGVAAAEVGGGLVREIQVLADQNRLAGLGLDVLDISEALESGNIETPAGRLVMDNAEISGRTAGRFRSVDEIINLPISVETEDGPTRLLRLGEVAQVVDGAEDERLRIRLNGLPGIKLSIQKQPQANTVAVVDAVNLKLEELESDGLIPDDMEIRIVDNQAQYVRRSLDNAITAAGSSALLAMLVVYIFLGSLRRTLIIGSAIPIAILVTFILMSSAGLTLNIMTLGGLALGIGMLVDSTIVMLENIYRHQRKGEDRDQASREAASEVNSAIVASTSTNLAAVLPFLFITGLVGLLFRELIFTISAAIVASMLVALTLVPALAGRIPAGREGLLRRGGNNTLTHLQNGYAWLLQWLLKVHWLILALFIAGLAFAAPRFLDSKQIFLPSMDEGRVYVSISADRGTSVARMNRITEKIEAILSGQPEVETLFTTVGGHVFGRSQHESANRSSIKVQLKPLAQRNALPTQAWIGRVKKLVAKERMAGIKVRIFSRGIRGIRLNRSDGDFALRIKGPDLEVLESLANKVMDKVSAVDGLSNLQHSAEEKNQELSVQVDRDRATSYGLTVEDAGKALRFALQGSTVTDFITEDRSIDVLLRLAEEDIANPADLENIILFSKTTPRVPVHLSDIAQVDLHPTPSAIMRDLQQRMVEVSASLSGEKTLNETIEAALQIVREMEIPKGYTVYEAGSLETLKEGRSLSYQLLGLAIFLVFVVMAVQYESLRNPVVIILSVPFAVIGVAIGLQVTGLPLSMPIWLGMIMLAGIVVNNAIVLVEYIEIQRRTGLAVGEAIIQAARLRLRPILMTTLTTVVGMMPLALALGEGAEMLQPLAVTIVSGLLFSTLVSLVLVPSVYRLINIRR
ncbi:efflux RND transporter permease subunit [Solemya velesiana gill symbiont]|uniref:Acriflavin resistance protein n=1 Tax=Solemya velesiana gill symbiont TaxID=1918948 RepID=A0A1T2KVN2_9GAMM|nr:efflux RND transporter permease subunit [Solemya velesiana gill symbiont]OOZ36909.1 acriflavin resistance protein [Solemya velesiana gill symbiont]